MPDTEDPVDERVSRVVVDLFGVEGANDAELSATPPMSLKREQTFCRFTEGLEWFLGCLRFVPRLTRLTTGSTPAWAFHHLG